MGGDGKRMMLTTIFQVYFHWNEYEQMLKFENESSEFRIVSQDTGGVLYEHRTSVFVNTKDGNTNEVRRSAEKSAV